MIKINSNYTIYRDPQQWVLVEKKMQIMTMGKFRGEERETTKETFHATLPQIANVIIERSGSDCESLEELKYLFKNAVKNLSEHIEFLKPNNSDSEEKITKKKIVKKKKILESND